MEKIEEIILYGKKITVIHVENEINPHQFCNKLEYKDKIVVVVDKPQRSITRCKPIPELKNIKIEDF